MNSVKESHGELIAQYADLIFKNVQLLLHEDVEVYLNEEPLTRYLAESLTAEGWPSRGGHVRYPIGNRRADIVTENPKHQLTITNETKYLVCDYPGAKRGRAEWKGISGTLVAQHLGIESGKPINAVDDVEKLKQAEGTHVSFLLVRMESCDRCGDEPVKQFVHMTGLSRRPWKRFDAQWNWVHPKSQGHLVKCNLWCRAIPKERIRST